MQVVNLLVIDWIVQLNNIALAFERKGHKDRLGVYPKQRFRKRGFSIPGLAVDQKRFACVHGGADLRQNVVFDHQVSESLHQRLRTQPVVGQFLALHHLGVLIQRHRRGTGVLIVRQVLARQVASRFSERKNARHVSHAERLPHADVMLPFQVLQQVVDQAEREAQLAGHLAAQHFAAKIKVLEQ